MTQKALIIFLLSISTLYCWPQANLFTPAQKESVWSAASKKYTPSSFIRRFFLGNNYRRVWSTPVQLPLFNMREMGFTIKELGGGQQTTSLQLEDKEGREWALRTIDKDVEKALPKYLRNTLAEKITQDMVSAAHPYAPLTITDMAHAAGIITAQPYFYYVPDDAAFGKYRKLFAGKLCMLEEREPTPDKSKTFSTEDFVDEILKGNKAKADGEAILRARLLDMLIADWDRHQDQWRFAKKHSAGIGYYYAIPRDRDQAYFYSKGLVVKLTQMLVLKHLVGFTESTKKLRQLNTKSWNFDRMFLNELDANTWKRTTESFLAALDDDIIKDAVKKMPPEVYQISGAAIEKKLVARRNGMLKDVMQYYSFLSKNVTVMGSDAAERFHVTGNKDQLTLTVSTIDSDNRQIYQRTFLLGETSKIYIIGLGGDDEFIVDKEVAATIKLHVDGGKGKDKFDIKGKSKIKIYDSDADAASYKKWVHQLLRIKKN